ncbi:phenylacetaldehyde reductase-like isoform X2 [Malus sylvestris]|uniref:phenylacetaldehyde reductase-like isoform X2 n=1 Tax=Malus sylvestris TaxID=3752 RepID=UPI0021AC98D8|nr:phenylacetaldehyde reductase-like isoform X2 [Malus sylvestris]
MSTGQGKTVCVTGASGYIASWLVKLLLQKGYTVKATVRDPNDPKKTEHLRSLDGAKERLHLFKADLLEEGAFDAAVDGCQGVFHTASPVLISVTDPQIWYVLSKILAEEAGWKFAEGNGIDMVSMNPGLCIGPLLNPTLMTSVEQLLNVMSGTPTPFLNYPFVDVRDVASAHIQAFEVPSASGRYCLVGHVVDGFDTLKILRQLYPTLTLAEAVNPSDSKYQVSQEKAKGLGITFLPLETSLRDTIESLKEKGFIKI